MTWSVEIPEADRERVARTIFEWKNRNPLVPRSWDRAMKLEKADCYSEADALFDAGLLAGPCPACDAPAVPQPVDREALERLAEKWATMDTPGLAAPSNQEWATGVDQGYSNAAAELLALLAGEQEQAAITNPDAIQRCPARGYADEPCVRPALHDGSHEWFEDGGEQEQVESPE